MPILSHPLIFLTKMSILFAVLASLSGCAKAEQRYITKNNIVFNSHTQRLDLYRPIQPTKETALIFLHGGGFNKGDKAELTPHAIRYAEQGYVTTSINYRLSMDAAYPAAVNDVKDAIRWMKMKATQYGFNPKKIVLVGYSAGGTLALNAGLDPAQDVAAIINVAGISDIGALLQDPPFPQLKAQLVQYMGERDVSAISPIKHVKPNSPPVLILHGSKDPVIPTTQSDALEKKLHSFNIPVKLKIIQHGDHEIMHPTNKHFKTVLSEMSNYIISIENDSLTTISSTQ